jgi:hypothetical protein
LEERVNKALKSKAVERGLRGRVLAWPRTLRPESAWMRSAAAAAIVFVVAGGGWGVYTRVDNMRIDKNQPARVIVMPARMPSTEGFTGAGAIRTPVTLPGPKAPAAVTTSPLQQKSPKKPAARLKTAPKPGPASSAPTNP